MSPFTGEHKRLERIEKLLWILYQQNDILLANAEVDAEVALSRIKATREALATERTDLWKEKVDQDATERDEATSRRAP